MVEDVISQIVDFGIDALGRHYSIYRGVVVDIDDPMNIDRLKVFIPSINVTDWALPRGSHGSHNCGFRSHPLPKVQDIVYITFEDGNPAKPLWEWHPWAEDQKPEDLDDPDVCGIITPKGTKILVNDRTGEVYIEAKTRLAIRADGPGGIVLAADRIMLNANETVIHHGENEGVININELTDKLNKLVGEIDSIRNTLNTHTHPGVSAGQGSTAPTTNQVSTPVTKFNKDDYEDKTFLH